MIYMAQHEYITLITMLRNVALFLLWKKIELKRIKKNSEFYVWNVPMHTQGFLRHTFLYSTICICTRAYYDGNTVDSIWLGVQRI